MATKMAPRPTAVEKLEDRYGAVAIKAVAGALKRKPEAEETPKADGAKAAR